MAPTEYSVYELFAWKNIFAACLIKFTNNKTIYTYFFLGVLLCGRLFEAAFLIVTCN